MKIYEDLPSLKEAPEIVKKKVLEVWPADAPSESFNDVFGGKVYFLETSSELEQLKGLSIEFVDIDSNHIIFTIITNDGGGDLYIIERTALADASLVFVGAILHEIKQGD